MIMMVLSGTRSDSTRGHLGSSVNGTCICPVNSCEDAGSVAVDVAICDVVGRVRRRWSWKGGFLQDWRRG